MKRVGKLMLPIGLFLLVVGGASAQDMRVSYLDGKVDMQRGAAWRALSVGDPLPADATLRLAANSCVEFSSAGARITLSKPGTYAVESVLSASRSFQSAGAGRVLAGILARLVAGPAVRRPAGSTGVRAEMAQDESGMEWVGGSAELSYREAKDFLDAGLPDRAIDALQKGLAEAEGGELSEGRYLLAQAYSLKGDTRSALVQLDQVQPAASAGWTGDFVLLKAKVLIDAFAFDSAVQLLKEQGSSLPTDAERGAMFYFLLGLASRGAGDLMSERKSLEKVVSAFGGTELAAEASRILLGP